MADMTGKNPDLFPLSLSQQNIWALERTYPGTSVNNICTTIRIEGRVDFVALQKSLQTVLAADSSLRTRVTLQGKTPLQYCVPYREESFPVFDFSQTSPDGIENWEMAVTREPMPLLDAPLYRFVLFRAGEHAGGVLIKIHHILSDGWSQVLLCNRIGQIYLDLLAGRACEIAEYPDYRLHVEGEQEYLRSEAFARDRAYWEEMLRHAGEPSVLKSVKSAAVSPVGRRLSFDLPQTINHAIYSFCMYNRVSPFLVFYMALAIYFKRIGGADRFTIGVPVFNRADYAFKQTTGMFVSTLPFSSELQDDWSLSDYSERLSEQWLELLRRAKFPFTEIQRLAEGGGREPGRLFNIALSYQDSKILESRDASVLFSGRWHYSGYQAEQLCIHLSNRENQRRYSVDYDYLTQLFSEQEIEAFHNCLLNILYEALSGPDKPIRRLSVLSAAERERVLYTFNNTAQPIYDHDLWAHFARTAEQYPSRAALICNGRRI
ncbi:MAG: non-ribosomal peptide synthetase, partial [Clostridiales bacterium]|nr:non-ribosomal peptide synthetase [Clostridiales bacterium]